MVTSSGPGSSPLARGLREQHRFRPGRGGIIPARAGFTRGAPRARWGREDHPRSRGVYPTTTPTAAIIPGSSPLARGLHDQVRGGRADCGIIPARAGFTRRCSSLPRMSRDHPRSRGVYRLRRVVQGAGHGSSPLARGLPTRRRCWPAGSGIIPARAGFTLTDKAMFRVVGGSSPLARGLHVHRVHDLECVGIIPARAGFTRPRRRRRGASRDHPRSRGVYSFQGHFARMMKGSSPLARGLLRSSGPQATKWRIIPARAGFT